MRREEGISRFHLRRGSVAALIGLLGSIAFHHPAPVGAVDEFYLECGTTEVREGDSFEVTLVYVGTITGGDRIGAFWHTDAGTADSTDYVHQDTGAIWGTPEDSADSRVNRKVRTRQDNLIEGNETFTVRFTTSAEIADPDDPERDNKCEITIIDDDPNIRKLEVTSDPVVQDSTYGIGEVIQISATFSTRVDVEEGGKPALGLRVGDKWKQAGYLRGSGTRVLVFGYTVKSEDRDSDGIRVNPGYQDRQGTWHNFLRHQTITASGTTTTPYRVYDGIDDQPDHKVDGSLSLAGTPSIISRPDSVDTYLYGETIEIAIAFSESLDVEGTRYVNLRMGTDDGSPGSTSWRGARYSRGSGTDTLVFAYTVRSGDRDIDGITMERTLIQDGKVAGLGGEGTITVAGTDSEVSPTFPGLFSQSGHKVDGRDRTAPTVSSLAVTSAAGDDSTYAVGDSIRVTVRFSEDVVVTGSPQLELDFDGSAKTAVFDSTADSAAVFVCVVAEGDTDADGIAIGADKLSLNEGTIQDGRGNDAILTHAAVAADAAHKVDGGDVTAPEVSSATVTSAAGDDSTYAIGDSIRVTVRFSEDVVVTGSPQLELDFDGSARTAVFDGTARTADFDGTPRMAVRTADFDGTADSTAVFVCVVAEGDTDADGIAIGADKLSLNEGTIQDGRGNDATLTHAAVTADAAHKVDGVRPAFSSATTSTDGDTLTVAFSEYTTVPALLRTISTLVNVALDQFFIAVVSVTVDGDRAVPAAAGLSDSTLTMTLDPAVTQSQEVEVAYDNIFARDAVGIFIDAAGNALHNFSSQSVTNQSTAADADEEEPPPDLTLSRTELDITEGATATYTVVLGSEPSADVTVTLVSSTNKLSAAPSGLLFTTDDWDTAQTVTLTADQDDDELNYWARVSHAASGGGYDSSSTDLYVVIDDDDE